MPLSQSSFDVHQPIRGYFTRELIGRGGFGEVWKADAPGGLEKAIKIVHAGIDSTRAERELRALQRVKDVRHPLTLSIERIEIIEGTLVIVTELADCSLKDVFRKHRADGAPGIPRDRLLALLRDAADALDYIYEEHSLQHLDIKPENLLVVGNRLKLGDFGLLKNIYERGASLVSGLTPTYAPPELFEGRPTRQSDQYSLAIVYQQMFTGELPFEGATSAQLAREHLSGVPRLGMLPRSERPIVARALSKVPGERFESCAALVSRLASALPDDADGPSEGAAEPAESHHTQTVSVAVPAPLGPRAEEDSSAVVQEPFVDPVLGAIELSLQQPRKPGAASRRSSARSIKGFVPTVFLGVGGTGGLVLQELRRRIGDAYGSLKEAPAIQMVLMDTDGKQLNALMQRAGDWDDVDVVALPLRRPEDYKFRESGLSKWLHRRWLYNMSRSLQTDGYRPLGRLAFVDHGARALVSVRSALARALAAESVARTASATGLPFLQGHVRVVIVASISGGTGSGIALDLAYAVRGELKRRGCSDEDVLGVLLHSTPGAPAERDKALANAYAALSELGHYSSPGRYYPGENAVKAPSFHGDNRTFAATYFVNLGDQLDTSGWRAGASRVAEYLFCATATPARMIVDAARRADEGRSPSSPSQLVLRSLDVCRLDRSDSREMSECIEQACRDVVTLWQTGASPLRTSSPPTTLDSNVFVDLCASPVVEDAQLIDAGALQWLVDSGLEPDALLQAARDIVEQEWCCTEQDHLRQLFAQLTEGGDRRRVPRQQLRDAADRLLDRILGDTPEAGGPAIEQPLIRDRLRLAFAARAADEGGRLAARVGALVDDPDAGVTAARAAADAMLTRLKELHRVLEQRLAPSASAPPGETVREPVPGDQSWLARFRRRGDAQPSIVEEMLAHAVRRLDASKLAALRHYLNLITVHISTMLDQLNHLSRDLKCLAAEFRGPAAPETPDRDGNMSGGPAARAYARIVHDALQQDRDRIARDVSDEFLQTVLDGDDKLRRFLGVPSQLQSRLPFPLRSLARKVVLSHVRQTTQRLIEESARRAESGEETDCERLVSEFALERRLRPETDRIIVVAPESADPASFQSAFGSHTDLIPARTNGITICCEGRPRPLEEVADELIQGQDLYRQLAEKLRTREDVRWGSLSTPPHADRSPPRRDAKSVPAP